MERIIDGGLLDDGSVQLLVHWTGYDNPDDYTWEPLASLTRRREQVLKYTSTVPELSHVTLPEVGGDCSNSGGFELRNWVFIKKVVEIIRQHGEKEPYQLCQTVIGFDGDKPQGANKLLSSKEAGIIIILFKSHFYVVTIDNDGTAFIADGSNYSCQSEQIVGILGRKIGHKLKP